MKTVCVTSCASLGPPGETQGHGIDQIDVASHQFSKGRLAIVAGKFPHQVHVVRVCHLPVIPGQRREGAIIFHKRE
jgi:hypothetical protein